MDQDDLERVGVIKYEEFFRDFLEANKLGVFSSEVTQHWRSRKEWVKDGRPNFEFLSNHFGNAVAPVANCHQTQYHSQVKQDMSVKEFCDYWKNRSQGGKDCPETLYLKDWHFCKRWYGNGQVLPVFIQTSAAIPEFMELYLHYFKRQDPQNLILRAFPSYKAYQTPIYFKSDWLNEFWDQRIDVADDYRFVYMGPKGSWTPFHADVFRSFSWSANICGCKKWLIYPPGQEKYLTDRLGNLAYDVTSGDMNDRQQFPKFEKALKPITVIQKEGEVIFVPSGWHHQVMNLEDTISINHNWTNAYGVFKMWEHLQSELGKVQRSIEDCKDMENWHQQCQVILRASCGISYEEFIEFLEVIARRRMLTITAEALDSSGKEENFGQKSSLTETEFESSVFQDWKMSVLSLEEQEGRTLMDYCRYDLVKIKECVVSVRDDQSFSDLQNEDLQLRLRKLLQDIDTTLKKQ